MGDAKGTALALMVELLAAGLVGAHFGYEAPSFLSEDGAAPGVGQLILAIDPSAFAGVDTTRIEDLAAALDQQSDQNAAQRSSVALSRFDDLAQAVESEPGARLPGARRLESRNRAAKEGITVDDSLLAQINALGRPLSVWN